MDMDRVAHITDGFTSWKEAGGPVELYKALGGGWDPASVPGEEQ